MSKHVTLKSNELQFFSYLLLVLYLGIGFIPNWQAVDRIAPQWLVMSGLNLLSIVFIFYKRIVFAQILKYNLSSKLNLTYLAFILWSIGSISYAINPTEVLVNISRQLNVFLMFFSMTTLIFSLRNKIKFIPWLISLILFFEVYAVFSDALDLFNTFGSIDGGSLKGLTANRNITAFSIAIKLPFTLFLIHIYEKKWIRTIVFFLITFSMLSLSMIQSRASFIAIGVFILAYLILNIIIYLKTKNKLSQIYFIGFLIFPFLIAVSLNQLYFATKGADVISRASTIALNRSDGSINQRLRYYEDVLNQIVSHPILGVGLGNWKLKSIDYDSKDINGYVVPYHAHSDFIQLGAELGIIGFLLYLGIFLWAVVYVYQLLRHKELNIDEKIFLFLVLTSLGIYSIDANLNFPIARPQVLIIWTLIIALITIYFNKNFKKRQKPKSSINLNATFLTITILLILPSIYINNLVYKSLKGQMILLQDFNSNQYNLPLNQVDNVVPNIPNITVTTIPINSVKARYYVNAKRYDKALALLDEGTKANPYLYYSEILKSQIFQEKGQLDSAKVYARKAFLGLPNNDLHSSRYLNLINITQDRFALDEAFDLLTAKNKINNWKNYLIVAGGLYPPRDNFLKERAKRATEIFPYNEEIKALYRQIAVGQAGVNTAASYSAKGLDYFNAQDYRNAAKEFEKALKANPLDYAHFENAATANYLIGNLEKAEQQIDVVINDLNPLNGKCEYLKALIYIKMGDPIGACPLLATSRDTGYIQADAPFNQYCK